MEMEDNMQDLIRIGTRKSRLALVQTNIVRQKIEEAFPGIRVEICEMVKKLRLCLKGFIMKRCI